MPIGTVKFFNEQRGYGFIQPDEGGNDAFVHITAVERAGMRSLREGQRIHFELEQDRRGKMAAVNLRADDGAAPEAAEAGEAAEAPEAGETAEAAEAGETAEAEAPEVAEEAPETAEAGDNQEAR